MKLRKYNEDYEYDYLDDDYTDDDRSDDMDHLCYLLRQMFRNSGIKNVDVSNSKMNLSISVSMSITESMSNVLNILSIGKKISKDISSQYESTVQVWSMKSTPSIVFDFHYIDENDDEMPF
jgi:hypothetical protein